MNASKALLEKISIMETTEHSRRVEEKVVEKSKVSSKPLNVTEL